MGHIATNMTNCVQNSGRVKPAREMIASSLIAAAPWLLNIKMFDISSS